MLDTLIFLLDLQRLTFIEWLHLMNLGVADLIKLAIFIQWKIQHKINYFKSSFMLLDSVSCRFRITKEDHPTIEWEFDFFTDKRSCALKVRPLNRLLTQMTLQYRLHCEWQGSQSESLIKCLWALEFSTSSVIMVK